MRMFRWFANSANHGARAQNAASDGLDTRSDVNGVNGSEPGEGISGLTRRLNKWEFSSEYPAIVREGHSRPPPEFGAPTLVWHLAVWPSHDVGEENVPPQGQLGDPAHHDGLNAAFFSEISDLLESLQRRGRVISGSDDIKGFAFDVPEFLNQLAEEEELLTGGDRPAPPHMFKVCDPQSLAFTLWWQDAAGPGRLNVRQESPAPEDLRVRVQAQAHVDHVTVSFYIDVGKPWDLLPVYSSKDAVGVRRKAVFEYIEQARAVCDQQIITGAVNWERVPEQGISPEKAANLLAASDYLYETLWEQFIDAFGLRIDGGVLAIEKTGDDLDPETHGEIFANFRALIFSIDGMNSPAEAERQARTKEIRTQAGLGEPLNMPPGPAADTAVGIGAYKTFDGKSGEGNTLLKAYWPFIRRMMPNADERDFIACGLRDWRVIYVTALGSPVETIGRDEDSGRFHPPSLPEAGTGPNPIRYLFLTKGEPHRDQVGRLVERINALGTMRLFALKNWLIIRNASIHIRLLGHSLDGILYHWSRQRHAIDMTRAHAPLNETGFETAEELERRHAYVRRLSALIEEVEPQLLRIGAQLDQIGKGGAGRLMYAINRSTYFINEFERMAGTLGIGHIETWTNYSQFVERGLQPTFDFIRSTGERFKSVRGRLQAITDIIQTNALIVETDATRENTEKLSKIANSWLIKDLNFWTPFLFVIIAQVIASLVVGLVEHSFGWGWPQIIQFFAR